MAESGCCFFPMKNTNIHKEKKLQCEKKVNEKSNRKTNV